MKYTIVCGVIAIILHLLIVRRSRNNVCYTFEDYYSNRDNNKNCYYNPDADLELPDMAQRHGYPVEKYHVITKDGYILTVFRIPHGKKTTYKNKKPVFIQHGMTLNSNSFVNTGRKSLGFILADAGYDVWLGNFRGSLYSRNHTHLSESDGNFWDYSFHELGAHDLPAQLDLVYEVTKHKIIFIGYSLGATAAYIYGSVYSNTAHEKVKIFINLAPSIYMDDLRGIFAFGGCHIWSIIEPIVQVITKGKLFPKHPMPSILVKLLCLPFPIQMRICQIPEMSALGFDFEQNDPETLPITHIQNSDTTTVKTVTHLCQLKNSGNFQHFDYGRDTNKEIYGTAEPKLYNLSDVKVPSYTITAENDLTVSKKAICRLHNMLPKETTQHGVHVVEYKNFNHLDFLVAKDVVPLVYDYIVMVLTKL